MKPYKLIELTQGSDAWKEFRRNKIGGSDIPAIVGVDPYNTRQDVLNAKLTGISKPISEYTQQLFDDGHAYETLAREAVNARDGATFKPAVVQSIVNENYIVSLDGLNAIEDRILEIKSTRKKEFIEMAKMGVCPSPGYYSQIQWQVYLTGLQSATLVVVNSDGGEMYEMSIHRNEKEIKEILIQVESFLKDMQTGVAPYLTLEIPRVKDIAESKKTVKELQKLIDKREEEIKQHAEDILKEYGATRIQGFGITIQMCERIGNVEYSRIKELQGVNLDAYRKKSTSYIKISETKKTVDTKDISND